MSNLNTEQFGRAGIRPASDPGDPRAYSSFGASMTDALGMKGQLPVKAQKTYNKLKNVKRPKK